jgi:uncharacterized protein RhaS with RHS repeats
MVPGYTDLRLLQLGVRFYDPQVGRFTQRDPSKDGINWYAYVGDDPVNGIDPLGLRLWKIVLPGDARWPQPGRPKGHIGRWDQSCVVVEGALARRAAERHFPGEYGDNGGAKDAFRHCVWACLTRLICGAKCYNGGVLDHENSAATWARGRWDDGTSPMDLANDEMGRKVAGLIGHPYETCEEGCADQFHKGNLYVLPHGAVGGTW